jgi:hypothetical protein
MCIRGWWNCIRFRQTVNRFRVGTMPLHWTIDSRSRTVEIVADGDVSVAEAQAYFDAVEGAGALSYNKLLDGIRGRAVMTPEELMSLVVRIRHQHTLGVMGALAVVATPEQSQRLARVLGAAAVADRPLRVFDQIKPARRWLEAQPRRFPAAVGPAPR